jgi:hypothetical protein
MKVGEPDLRNFIILQQIIRASRALKAGTKNQHPHEIESPFVERVSRSKVNLDVCALVTPAQSLQYQSA